MRTTSFYFAALAAVALLAGCASAKQINGPNGRPAFSITCGAAVQSKCLEKAGEVCPAGYTVLSSGGGQYLGQWSTSQGNANWNKNGGAAQASSTSVPMVSQGHLLVECK